jgi:hypothetical protein
MKKKRQSTVKQEIKVESARSTAQSYRLSELSPSVYSSPREIDPLVNLNKIDLTLDSQVPRRKFDIHQYLIDLFTECKRLYIY